jgi:hypothetical protein
LKLSRRTSSWQAFAHIRQLKMNKSAKTIFQIYLKYLFSSIGNENNDPSLFKTVVGQFFTEHLFPDMLLFIFVHE